MMSEASDRPTSSGPDFFGLFAREVADLLSSSSCEANTSENGNVQGVCNRNKSKRLFRDIIENSISEEKLELLKPLLRRCLDTLTKEVDEVTVPVNRILDFLSLLSVKKSGFCLQGSDGQDSKERPSKRIKKLSNVVMCTSCCNTKAPVQRTQRAGVKEACEVCGSSLGKKEQLWLENYNDRGYLHDPKSGSEKEVKVVNKNLKFLLEYPDSTLVEERIKKQSEQLSATLDYMEKCLGNFLDTTASHCRPMSHQEKRRLGVFIQKLPPENREIVAEMISNVEETSKTRSRSAEISNQLYKLDKSKLWRLYFYVKAVEH